MSQTHPKPVVLIIRDGWGRNPDPKWNHCNAVHLAQTPVDDALMRDYPHVLIRTCGTDVGLPAGVMGNSEVGHQNIGAGRIVEQELMRISGRIDDGTFFENPKLIEAFKRADNNGGRVHLMGLCSDGRVHSDLNHLYTLLEMGRRLQFPGDRVAIHAFTDGRDTLPDRGVGFVEAIESKCREIGIGAIATVIGRYYAMDRDNRWDRVEVAYRLLTQGKGVTFSNAGDAIRAYYANPTEPNRAGDEFIAASVIAGSDGAVTRIEDGDSVIFFNFRGDRPRELVKAFVRDTFPFVDPGDSTNMLGFDRGQKLDLFFATMTAYETGLGATVAFEKPPKMDRILGSYVSSLGLKQFRCAETEKYPHVTFFFNDYRDDPFVLEDRAIIPSPRDISTYDQKPEMAAFEVTEAVLDRLASHDDDLQVVNLANGDMVGHTGNLKACVRAVEVVDECVGRMVAAVKKKGGALVVTADHGNCEQMIDPESGSPHTAHTTYDVELIVVDDRHRDSALREGGRLADIAPTLLALLGLEKPTEMSGESLVVLG